MSIASPFRSDSAASDQPGIAENLQIDPELPVRFVGFWTAVVVPFVLLGLVATGTAHQSPALLSGLLAANVVGLVLGKDYKR